MQKQLHISLADKDQKQIITSTHTRTNNYNKKFFMAYDHLHDKGFVPLVWYAFLEGLLPSSCRTWSSFFVAEDSLLSLDIDRTGADVDIVDDSWWFVNWGKYPGDS